MPRWMPVAAALATLALGCAGCGGSSASKPLAESAAPRLCPASDASPRRVLDHTPTPVLVPGHPSSVLICRYTGLNTPGLRGVRAGALSVTSAGAAARLGRELDALRPFARGQSCPAFGGRSELFVFAYPNASAARVLLSMDGCIPVTNGRVTGEGLDLHLGAGEVHWPDEGLL
jgi:hypothetical protein